MFFLFFFFNDTATTEIYTLSLHDALPIFGTGMEHVVARDSGAVVVAKRPGVAEYVSADRVVVRAESRSKKTDPRSEEHTSELQSQSNLVCRLLLEKKK